MATASTWDEFYSNIQNALSAGFSPIQSGAEDMYDYFLGDRNTIADDFTNAALTAGQQTGSNLLAAFFKLLSPLLLPAVIVLAIWFSYLWLVRGRK